MRRRLLDSSVGLVLLSYPFLVYWGIQLVQPWQIAAVLLVILGLRFLCSSGSKHGNRAFMVGGVLYGIFAVWQNSEISLRFYPVWVNFSLLTLFWVSLYFPPPVVERLARLQHPDLSAQAIHYTRKVTQVWCVFFVANGLLALGTALWAEFYWWSLYNGCIAYLLMGALMGGEYWVRLKRMSADAG